MKFLLDTNVIIPAEPASQQILESGAIFVTELLRLLAEGSHQFYVHSESINEIRGDRNKTRREVREVLLRKYPILPNAPKTSKRLESILGSHSLNRHDKVDLILLAALDSDAVDYLVTNDRGLHKEASRLELSARVCTPVEAISIIRALFPVTPVPPPAVKSVYVHELDQEDPIFDSLRKDYPGFDVWLTKCKREHRKAWIIDSPTKGLGGLCIIKSETFPEYALPTPTLKICTFKVSENSRGYRYGELLLKAVFDYTFKNNYLSIYLTVFPKQAELISLFEGFGFQALNKPSLDLDDELILGKMLKFSVEDYNTLNPLDFNIKFGPYNVKFDGAQAFMVPIVPKYHRMLFPEAEAQLEVIPGQYPFGNGLRKAYLCHSSIRRICPGDILFFYRSRENRGISAYGVVENIIISKNSTGVARSVGKRTVYRFHEIEKMCSKEVLVILFRLSYILIQPISIQTLIQKGILKTAPQSITTLSEEAKQWLKTQFSNQY
ncbi:MAG: GNAT family N-acetyltransferase [Tildeniella nuda ZEHNDER 1965/U140]|jgi:ribosomal protein S18 acetylase RimI-like enzyme/predicted nucleic acid-binding protein|nr:GNAT family N-acetyltransferase [Tildeniella nuda ZEHNDER 1965/U140]